jgi:hypothetical protein
MAAAKLGRLLRWYPPSWRERYGEEFVVFMQDSFGSEEPSLAARLSIVAGGVRERARRSGLTGDSVPPPDRVRAGVLTVLVSWTAMVVAGASFAKMAEHFDEALPHAAGAHRVPDLSYAFIQNAAGVAGLIVVAGAALALPALVRYLRSGGWPSIRAHVVRAAGSLLLTLAVAVPLEVWAHHLSSPQRNGGSTGYGVLFVGWAALAVVTVVLWAVLAVIAAGKVTLSRSLLVAQAAMAVVVTLAAVGILAATGVWWALVAERAPTFLGADPASPLNARLVATVSLMVLAAAAAMTGTVRIARSFPEWRRA